MKVETCGYINAFATHDQIVGNYLKFVKATVRHYLDDIAAFSKHKGEESCFVKYGWLLLQQTVDEAHHIMERYRDVVPDKFQLMDDLQRISEGALTELKAVAEADRPAI